MPKIFNRKDAQVQKDAIELSEDQFVEKYKDTTASEEVLRSVYGTFGKQRKAAGVVHKNSEQSTEFVAPPAKEETDDEPEDELEEPAKEVKKKKETAPKKEKEVKAKPADGEKTSEGRTPRMRELMKTLENGKDKATVKRHLDEEGFLTTGAGFHSEWNRVSKSLWGK